VNLLEMNFYFTLNDKIMKVSHKQVQEYSKILAKLIELDNLKFDVILIITRWWLIPGYYIANELWIKRIDTINLSSYNWKERKEIINETNIYFDIDKDLKYLIVDDLIDSWKTLSYIEKYYFKNNQNYEVATLFRKREAIRDPKYCLRRDINKEEWIEFEYEI